jgi:hypothetical protein
MSEEMEVCRGRSFSQATVAVLQRLSAGRGCLSSRPVFSSPRAPQRGRRGAPQDSALFPFVGTGRISLFFEEAGSGDLKPPSRPRQSV